MTTIAKRVKNRKPIKQTPKPIAPIFNEADLPKGEAKEIEVALIDFSANNYRKIFKPADIEELAGSIKQHGLLHPLTVRPSGERYELVIGECRLRAANLAGITKLPVLVRELTNEEADEIRLAENLKRVDPHPMEEALLIAAMQTEGKSVDTIALRIGKSKAFVYSRIKLAGLTAALQEIFLEDKLTINEAFNIATLSVTSQEEFFQDYCTGWTKTDFKISNLSYALSRYRYDLKNAPFDTKDKNLKPQAGACTNCPFNSATLKSLFPDMAKEAICTNQSCYKDKCMEHTANSIRKLVAEQLPDALLIYSPLSEETEVVLQSLPETDSLPRLSRHEVNVMEAPKPPDKEDYFDDWNTEEGEEPEFDEEGFNRDMAEYEQDLAGYQAKAEKESTKKALAFNSDWKIILYNTEEETNHYNSATTVTAKEVQQAIKEGTATPELLQGEIQRITAREQRAKELDIEKIQLQVHEAFLAAEAGREQAQKPTAADHVCARLIIYQSLDYSVRHTVNKALFGETDLSDLPQFYKALADLSDENHAFLIRMAIAGKSESKYPTNITAFALVELAKASGLDVAAIEQAQQAKAEDRQDKMEVRVQELEKKIAKLKL